MAKCEFCGGHAQSYHNRLICFRHRKAVGKGEHLVECDKCKKMVKKVTKVKRSWFRWGHYCQSCYDAGSGEVAGEVGVKE